LKTLRMVGIVMVTFVAGLWCGHKKAIDDDYHFGVRHAIIQHAALMNLGDKPVYGKHYWRDFECDHRRDWYAVIRIPCPDCAMIGGAYICTHCGAIIPYGKGQ